jgi:hypothetical protein
METIDFMDPKLRRRNSIMLMVGYVLVAIAILLLTTIFVFYARGYNYQNGHVIQNGMVYLSSTPNPAQIYINGALYNNGTDTRILLPAGTYNFKLERTGYRSWQRTIVITGGQVVYYEYPFLFPDNLTANTIQTYASAPALISQSLDEHWLVVAQANSLTSFDLYDLTNPQQPSTTISLPAGLLSTATSSESLQPVAWSNDNSHLLLKHIYDNNVEYILLDISSPAQSINLTKTLSLPTSNIDLQFNNEQSDQYLVLNTATQTLYQDNLSSPQLQLYASKVLAYKAYNGNTLLYATPDPKETSEVNIDLNNGSQTYLIRRLPTSSTYLLNLTAYDNNLYVAIAASNDHLAYIYENPINQITDPQIGVAVPVEVFSLASPSYLAFSNNAQYILFESGTSLAVYDDENALGYTYSLPSPLDQPQAHVTWMDGAQLTYISNGQLEVFDYDNTNRQTLISGDARYTAYFDPSYKYVYTLVPSVANPTQELLTLTALLTPADI